MTSLFSRLQKLNKEGTPCRLCGAPVTVYTGREGTSSYESIPPDSLPAVLNLIEAVKESRWWATEWASTGSPYAREQMAAANVKVDETLAVFVSGQEEPK